jgi:predicted MFS family arabinose efflux permease
VDKLEPVENLVDKSKVFERSSNIKPMNWKDQAIPNLSMTLSPTRAWIIALGLAFGPTVALGFARFAYALLLPAMRAELKWSYSLSGGMNTANAVGYLIGALIATPLMRTFSTKLAFIAALFVTALALVGAGSSENYVWLVLVRGIAGIGGAIIFIAGGALTAHAASSAPPRLAGLMLTTYYAGAGFGIFLSGISLPFALAASTNWRSLWLLLGLVSALVSLISSYTAWYLPNIETRASQRGTWSPRVLLLPLFAYACFALGYIAYMTFSVAFIKANGATTFQIAVFWASLGLAAMLAPSVWSIPITRWRAARGMGTAMTTLALGAVLPLVSSHFLVMLISAVCFGGSFLSVVASTTALARRDLPNNAWNAGIALFTGVFAAGQSFGPLISGALSDGTGGLRSGLAWSAGVLAVGAVTAFVHPAKPD